MDATEEIEEVKRFAPQTIHSPEEVPQATPHIDNSNAGGPLIEGHAEDDMHDSDSDSSTSSTLSIPDESIDFDLVYAQHSFAATVEGQVNVVKGNSMVLLDDTNNYWWLVRVLATNEVGYIPAENVETPFERLARLNRHRNVDFISPTQAELNEVQQSFSRVSPLIKPEFETFYSNTDRGRVRGAVRVAGEPSDSHHTNLTSSSSSNSSELPRSIFDVKRYQYQDVSLFRSILGNPEHYRRFLKCTSPEAQEILEHCQLLLDSRDLENDFRRQIVTAMQRLAANTRVFPSWFFIHGPISLSNEYAMGSGGFGDIYRATLNGEALCLKVLRANQAILHDLTKSFAREAILWSQLSHPSVFPFYGLYIFRSQLSFVSPWAENGCITDFLNQQTDANRALLSFDTIRGVEYLHSRGIIHGDIKSANVLVDGSGRAYLADFGLSNVDDPQIIHWTSQSSVASKGGSVRWQAPELHKPEADNDTDDDIPIHVHNTEMTDVYAWGCLCYEIFTGRLPFYHIRFPYTVMHKILQGHTPLRPKVGDPAWLEYGLTESIWTLIEECWKTDPNTRPDVHSIISRLELETPAIDSRPPPQWPAGSSMRFRKSRSADFNHSLKDLNDILSRFVDDKV